MFESIQPAIKDTSVPRGKAAERAAVERVTEAQRGAISEAAARSLEAVRAGHNPVFRAWDDRFHRAVADASENAQLKGLIDDTVAVHARCRGQAACAAALRKFIEHAQAIPGVRFMRRCEIAQRCLDTYPPETGSNR